MSKIELNKYYNMDCLKGMKQFPDKFFDLAIVDPPYYSDSNLHYFFGNPTSTTNVKRREYNKSESWQVPTQEYYDELVRVSKHQIIYGINYFDFKGVPHGRIIWDKQRAGLINSFSDAEIASCSLINGVRIFRYRWDGMLQGNMKNKEYKVHVTQKPVELYLWILNKYAKPGWKILDTHTGSASSLIACHRLNFDYIGFEIDPVNWKNGNDRLEREKAQYSIFDKKAQYSIFDKKDEKI